MSPSYVGHPSCPSCLKATQILRKIQAKIAIALAEVQETCGRYRAENRKRWEKFAKRCRWWLIGRWYFRRYRMPLLLEEPHYSNRSWFWEAQGGIEALFMELHRTLVDDPYEHMHDKPASAYYKNPVRGYELTVTTLGMLIRLEYPPALPPEFDLTKLARELGAYTMCAATYQVVPVAQCEAATMVHKERPTTVHIRKEIERHRPGTLKLVLQELKQ